MTAETTTETTRGVSALEVAPAILEGYAEELDATAVRLRTECGTDEDGKPEPPCGTCEQEAQDAEVEALVLREVAAELPQLVALRASLACTAPETFPWECRCERCHQETQELVIAQRDRIREHEAALGEILDGAPERDPGEGTWTSLEDAYQAGVDASHFDLAEIARRALGLPTAVGDEVEVEGDQEDGPCFICGDEGIVTVQVEIGPADSDQVLVQSHAAPLCQAHFGEAISGQLDVPALLAERGAIRPVEATDVG